MSKVWTSCSLGEVVTFQRGFDITQKEQITGLYYVYSSSGPKSTHDRFKVKAPGVIIGRKGTLGTVFFAENDFWPHDTTLWVKDFHGNNAKFVFYFLKTMGFEQYDAGAANPSLNRNHIHTLIVTWPNLPTQGKIAAILSAYDDLIENNLRRIKILEEMAQRLYREWFVHFRFPGHERVPLVDSPLGKIPEGWEVVKLGGILEKVKRRKRVKKQDYEENAPIPVVDQGRNFIGGYTSVEEALHDDPLPIIVFGDHTRVLKYIDFPFACGADGTQLLKPNTEKMPISLFYYVLKSIDLSDFAYARHFKFLKEQEILLPEGDVAPAFKRIVDHVRDLIKCLRNQNKNLHQTRDLLLPRLISGELDISDSEIKTPYENDK